MYREIHVFSVLADVFSFIATVCKLLLQILSLEQLETSLSPTLLLFPI